MNSHALQEGEIQCDNILCEQWFFCKVILNVYRILQNGGGCVLRTSHSERRNINRITF
jgi:hypothetical protein